MIYYSIGHVAASFCLEHKGDNNECIFTSGPLVVFTKTNFSKDNYTLSYFTIINISFLQQIVIKMENTKKIEDSTLAPCWAADFI